MKYSQAKQGRVFVLRLEDGDILHEEIESFAKEKGINAAYLNAVGGVDKESILVVGPKDARAETIVPMEHILADVHEVTGTGTLFPDDEGNPLLHMHISCGRGNHVVTGCIRKGVKVWHVLEVIIVELVGCTARRLMDDATGFKLMQP